MRRDVRLRGTRLKSHETLGTRVWTFLNSGLGIWLLSTVVVGLASFGWAAWSRHAADETARKTAWQHLTTEMNARAAHAKAVLEANATADVTDVLTRTGITAAPVGVVVYPEYRERPLQSLFWEQQELARDVGMTDRVQLTLYGLLLDTIVDSVNRGSVSRKSALESLKALRRPDSAYNDFRIRWDKNGRAFVRFGNGPEREWKE